jgi:hypothetical protein
MGELRQPLRVAIGVVFVDQNRLAFDVAELGQPAAEKRGHR